MLRSILFLFLSFVIIEKDGFFFFFKCKNWGKIIPASPHPHPLKDVHDRSWSTVYSPVDCSLPGSSSHGIFQARILEWVTMLSSRGSCQPRDPTCTSCIGRQILYHRATSLYAIPYSSLLILLENCMEFDLWGHQGTHILDVAWVF